MSVKLFFTKNNKDRWDLVTLRNFGSNICPKNAFSCQSTSDMTKNKLLFFRVAFKLFCLIGFLYQILEISIVYFDYKTSTKIVFKLDNKFINPSIIFCVRYPAILDRTKHLKYGILPRYRYNSTERYSDMSKLTIADIFDLTPDASEVILSCEFRENYYQLGLIPYNRTECYSLLHVTKYQEGGFICYQFRTTTADNKFRCAQAALSHNSNKELYFLLLHQRFFASNAIKLISFVPDGKNSSVLSMPIISRSFYDFKLRYASDLPETSKQNAFRIWGDMYSITSLPKPYDTNCVEDKEKGYALCHRRCNIAAFKRHGYFPSNEYTIEPLPMKHLNQEALLNETLVQDIKSKSEACLKKCSRRSCNYWYSVTVTETFLYYNKETIALASTCSNRPSVTIQFLPRITFMEFVMYMSSSLGIWFGISIMSINPFNSRRKCVTKRKVRQKTFLHSLASELRDRRVQSLRIIVQDLNKRVKELEHI